MSSSATRKSAAGEKRAGRCSPPSTISPTTTPTLAVCPTAQASPSRLAAQTDPCLVASVDTAARWSGSKAWRKPSSSPMPLRARIPGVIVDLNLAKPATLCPASPSKGQHDERGPRGRGGDTERRPNDGGGCGGG